MMGRPRSCECGECSKCRAREYQAARWAAMTPEERAAVVAKRDREKVRAGDRRRYYSNRVQRLAQIADYAVRNRERVTAIRHEWRKRNPEKVRAHSAVARAKRKGELIPQPCEACGTELRVQAHHPDYAKPLDVVWLCAPCHNELHRIEEVAA